LGHAFRTSSDTEVVLRGYLEWGEAVPEHLNGMFAFAIWDGRRASLLLARDRLGIKPLYYYPTRDGVLFGSEAKGILANPRARAVVDGDGIRGLFSASMPPAWSLWHGMHQVEPGTVVRVDADGIRSHQYWQLETREHTDDPATTTSRVRELLTDIVRRQLVADVDRCVLLSGGLDSSTVAGLAAAQGAETGEPVRTFSVDLPGDADHVPDALRPSRDAPFVRTVVQYIHSAHREVTLDPRVLSDPAIRRAVIEARDMPAGLGDVDSSLYLLFEAVRADSTVALSGESADELFGGYPWFHDDAAQRGGTFPWMDPNSPGVDGRVVLLRPEVRRSMAVAEYTAAQYADAVASVDQLPEADDLERRMRVMSHLHLTRHVRALLDRKDRISMAVGLEVRVPFCDHRLVEYVYNVPWSLKCSDGREKTLLRQAAGAAIPRQVAERRKSGYPSTQHPAYTEALQSQAKDVLAETDHPMFALVDRSWLEQAAGTVPTAGLTPTRHAIDLTSICSIGSRSTGLKCD
jgi:asparagine synthase (glutamine-hydrolysing)